MRLQRDVGDVRVSECQVSDLLHPPECGVLTLNAKAPSHKIRDTDMDDVRVRKREVSNPLHPSSAGYLR